MSKQQQQQHEQEPLLAPSSQQRRSNPPTSSSSNNHSNNNTSSHNINISTRERSNSRLHGIDFDQHSVRNRSNRSGSLLHSHNNSSTGLNSSSFNNNSSNNIPGTNNFNTTNNNNDNDNYTNKTNLPHHHLHHNNSQHVLTAPQTLPTIPHQLSSSSPQPSLEVQNTSPLGYWSTSSWEERLRYFAYYLPITSWLPKYNLHRDLKSDIAAGLSVGAVLIPQSMAYASILELPAIHGLITALFAGIVYFIFGHSSFLSVGPQAATSILLAESVMSVPIIRSMKQAGHEVPTELILSIACSITFVCGIVTLIFGLFRLGFVDGVFSRPVLSGLICGVGMQLITDQIPKITGIPPCKTCHNSIQKLGHLYEQIFVQDKVNLFTLMIGICCISFLFFYKNLKLRYKHNTLIQQFPNIFAMVIVVTTCSYLFDFHGNYGVSTIGGGAAPTTTPLPSTSPFDPSVPPNTTATTPTNTPSGPLSIAGEIFLTNFKFPQLFFQNNFGLYLSHGIILAVLTFVETQLVNKTVTGQQAIQQQDQNNNNTSTSSSSSTTTTSHDETPPTPTAISPNRELIALGLMHLVTSLFGGYIACGSLARTRVSFASGARSQITNAVVILLNLTTILLLMPFFANLPHVVSSSIVFFVATGLLETHELFFTYQTKQYTDFSLNLILIFITYLFGIDLALFCAFAVCLLLVIKQQNTPSVRLLSRYHHTMNRESLLDLVSHHTHQHQHDHHHHNHNHSQSHDTGNPNALPDNDQEFIEFKETYPLIEVVKCGDGILIYQIDGPLFFCNAENLKDRLHRIEVYGTLSAHPSSDMNPLTPYIRGVVFDLQSVTSIDTTGISVLIEIIQKYHSNNIPVILVKLRKSLLPLFINAEVTDLIGMYCFKRTINAAIDQIETFNCEADTLHNTRTNHNNSNNNPNGFAKSLKQRQQLGAR